MLAFLGLAQGEGDWTGAAITLVKPSSDQAAGSTLLGKASYLKDTLSISEPAESVTPKAKIWISP